MTEIIEGYQVTYDKKSDGSIEVSRAYHASSGIQCSYGKWFASYEEMVRAIRNGIWDVGSGRTR